MKYLLLLVLLLPNFASAALDTNLISYWKFDESSGNAVDAHGSNDLTNNNTVPFVAAKINNGADLERGSSHSFSIADASQAGLDIAGDFSVSFWYKAESVSSERDVFGKSRAAGGDRIAYLLYHGSDNKFNLDVSEDGTQTASKYYRKTTNSAYADTTGFHHLVATFDLAPSNAIVFYIDGSAVASTNTYGTGVASVYDSADPFRIGIAFQDAYGQFYDGIIDEFGIWDRVLTSDEVTELYNAGAGLAYPWSVASVATPILGLVHSFWIW